MNRILESNRSSGGRHRVATALFADLPFSGEVNLLTTSAFGPGELFSGNAMPRGVAYFCNRRADRTG